MKEEGAVTVDVTYDEGGKTVTPAVIDGHPPSGKRTRADPLLLSEACGMAREVSKDAVGDEQFAATDPAVKLRSAVAGTALQHQINRRG